MAQRTVLVVETDEREACALESALQRSGSRGSVIVVSSASDAEEYLFSEHHNRIEGPTVPALLLLDLHDRAGGLGLLKSVKSNTRTRGIPVVLLSKVDHEHDVRELYQSGANSYLEKPDDAEELANMVSAVADYWLGLNLCAGASN